MPTWAPASPPEGPVGRERVTEAPCTAAARESPAYQGPGSVCIIIGTCGARTT